MTTVQSVEASAEAARIDNALVATVPDAWWALSAPALLAALQAEPGGLAAALRERWPGVVGVVVDEVVAPDEIAGLRARAATAEWQVPPKWARKARSASTSSRAPSSLIGCSRA